MGAIKRIAQEATDNVVRWLDSLSRKSGVYMGKDEMYEEVGEKAEKLMINAPQMFEYYEDIPLYQGLRDAAEGSEDLALMDPATFRKLAAPIATEIPEDLLYLSMAASKPPPVFFLPFFAGFFVAFCDIL